MRALRRLASPDAGIRRGDRVVLRSISGEVMAGRLMRESARRIELAAVNESGDARTFDRDEVSWMVRILWASQ